MNLKLPIVREDIKMFDAKIILPQPFILIYNYSNLLTRQ